MGGVIYLSILMICSFEMYPGEKISLTNMEGVPLAPMPPAKKDEMEKIIILSSFLAGGIGARGTPSIFVNEIFSPGYISKEQIINMLK